MTNDSVLLQLLYLCVDHDSKSGLFKAMSLLCGSEVDPNNTEVDSKVTCYTVSCSTMAHREIVNYQWSLSVSC